MRAPWTSALLLTSLAWSCARADDAADNDKRVARIDETWRMFSRCLVGKPLGAEDKPSSRLRMVELTVLVEGSDKHPEWPGSCAVYAKELLAVVSTLAGDAAVDKYAPLATELRMFEGTSVDVYIADDKAPLVDRLWEAARGVGLEPISADAAALNDAPSAPIAAAPIEIDKLVELGPSTSYAERVEMAPGRVIRFALGGGDAAALYCTIGSDKAVLDHVSCHEVSGKLGNTFVPLSAEAEDATWYFDLLPKRAVHSHDGKMIEAAFGQSAFVFDDGTIADVTDDPFKPELIRGSHGGRLERVPLVAPGGGRWLGFRAGAIVGRGPIRGAAGRPVMVQDVQKGRIGLGGRIDSGEVPPDIELVEGCRHADGVAIAIVGAEPTKATRAGGAGAASADDPPRTVAMLFKNGKEWTKAKFVQARFGKEPHAWDERWWHTMTCGEGNATLTYLTSDERIGQVQCNADACDSKLSEPMKAHGSVVKRRATALGGKVLVLGVARATGPMTGLTDSVVMRLAPISEIADATDQVVVSDEDHQGLAHVGKSIGLVGTSDAAVALIHSDTKLYAVRIDAAGKLVPLVKR